MKPHGIIIGIFYTPVKILPYFLSRNNIQIISA
nr:MAG TPA: hypothetical protein [Caudoviricetes sp.]